MGEFYGAFDSGFPSTRIILHTIVFVLATYEQSYKFVYFRLRIIRYYSLPHLNRAGTINASRPVFYSSKYIESNGILSNYMVIYRVDPM